MGSFLDFWNSAKKQAFTSSGSDYQTTYTEQAKRNMWEKAGLDPDKFDIQAFDKNGAGMYIKPQYMSDSYKKKIPQIQLPEAPQPSGAIGVGTTTQGGMPNDGTLFGVTSQYQDTGNGQMTGGGMTAPTPISFNFKSEDELVNSTNSFEKSVGDMTKQARIQSELDAEWKASEDKKFAEMEAMRKELGIKSAQEIEAEKNREWNDNLIPTFGEDSKFKSESDDGAVTTGAKWTGNALMSLWNIVGGTGNAVVNPYDTGKAVVKLADGTVGHMVNGTFQALNKAGIVSDEVAQRSQANADKNENYNMAGKMGEMLVKPYSSVDGFKETLWSDPARIVGDILTVVSAGAGGVSKLSQAQKASLIQKVQLASTLEQKSALIQQAVNMLQISKGAEKIAEITTKINPYIQAPILAVRGGKLLGQGTASLLSNTTGFGVSQATGFARSTITEILNNPVWKKWKLGERTEDMVIDDLSNAINAKKLSLSESGKGYDAVRKSGQTVRIETSVADDILAQQGITVDAKGKLNFGDTNMGSQADMTAIQSAYDMFKKRVVANNGELTTRQFLNFRQAIDDTIGYTAQTTSKGDYVVSQIRQAIDKAGKTQVKGLSELDAQYADKLRKYTQIQKDWLTKDIVTGEMRLKDGAFTKIFNSNKKGRERIFAELDDLVPGIGDDIKAMHALRDVSYAGDLKVGLYSRSLILGGTFLTGGAIPTIGALILTNPRITVPLLEAYGKISRVPARVLKGIQSKIENGIKLIAPERKVIQDIESKGYKAIYNNLTTEQQLEFSPPNLPEIHKQIVDMADEYNKYQGLEPIQEIGKIPEGASLRQTMLNLQDDLTNVQQVKAYGQLKREATLQYDFFESKGYKLEPYSGETPYKNSAEIVEDIAKNKHLYFKKAENPHPLLSDVDATGLTAQDKLTAVQDLLGYTLNGYNYGPMAKEGVYLKHAQMFSDDALVALANNEPTVNSWVGASVTKTPKTKQYLNIAPIDRPYAEQKVAILDEANRNPFAKIHDMNFKREGAFAKFLDPKANYMITTAYNPMGQKVDEAVNIANQTKLKEWLTKNKYEWKEQLGKYDNEEKSLIIKIRNSADQTKIDKFVESFTPKAENLRIVTGKAFRYDPRDYSQAYMVDLRRNKIRLLDDNVDNYYSEIDGKKYQLPLYDDTAEIKVDNFADMLKSNRKTIKQFLGKDK